MTGGDKFLSAIHSVREGLSPMSRALFLQLVGNEVKTGVIKRTKGGRDASEVAFVPYSPGYAAYKDKMLRDSNPVTLMFRYQMLSAIRVRQSGGSVLVYFGDQAERIKGAAHNFGTARLPKRHFFAISDRQQASVRAKFYSSIVKVTR